MNFYKKKLQSLSVQDTSQILLKANLTVVDQAECRQKYDLLEFRGLRGGLAQSQMWGKEIVLNVKFLDFNKFVLGVPGIKISKKMRVVEIPVDHYNTQKTRSIMSLALYRLVLVAQQKIQLFIRASHITLIGLNRSFGLIKFKFLKFFILYYLFFNNINQTNTIMRLFTKNL